MKVTTVKPLGGFRVGDHRSSKFAVTVPVGTPGEDLGTWPVSLGDDAPWRLIRVSIDGTDYDVPAVQGHHVRRQRTKRAQPNSDSLRSLLP